MAARNTLLIPVHTFLYKRPKAIAFHEDTRFQDSRGIQNYNVIQELSIHL